MAPQTKVQAVARPSDGDVVAEYVNHKRLGPEIRPSAVIENLQRDPTHARAIVRDRTWDAVELLQRALHGGHQDAADALRNAIQQEFVRTNGLGPKAGYLFRGVLRLEGPGAEQLQAEMRGLLATIDQRGDSLDLPLDLRPSAARDIRRVDEKSQIAERAKHDPEYGRLYGRFFDKPFEAATQLAKEAAGQPELFQSHLTALGDLMRNNPTQAQELATVARELKGAGSGIVQTAIAQQLYGLMRQDFDGLRAVEKTVKSPDKLPQKARLEKLVPTLSALLSEPAVAKRLVRANRKGEEHERAAGPSLNDMLTMVLHAAYNDATRATARANVRHGAARMFVQAANDTGEDRTVMSETGGTFLGEAARVEDAVGFDASVAKRTVDMLNRISDFAPDAPEKVMKAVALVLDGVSNDKHDLSWTTSELNAMLHAAFEAAHPRPAGSDADPTVESHEQAYMDFRRLPADSFNSKLREHE